MAKLIDVLRVNPKSLFYGGVSLINGIALCANVLYTLYAHTGATHFSFTVAIAKRTSELKQRFIHALLPPQLGMAICYQYESGIFLRLTG